MKPTSLALAVWLAAPFASRVEAGNPKCFSPSREGHCIVVQLNGQTGTKVSKKTKKSLKELGALSYQGEETRYEIPTPVRGELDLRADFVAGATSFFGGGAEVEAYVVPVEGQSLDTARQRTTDRTVQIGGSASVKEDDVLKENHLRPGKYLLTVRLRGSSNWDRQVLFFEVVD